MKKFAYPCIAYRQQKDSPIQVAFVAPAGDILDWAGVPRKSDEMLTGYQRFRDLTRVDQEITPFFQNPANSSPTAIIVALRAHSGIGHCVLDSFNDVHEDPVVTTLRITLDNEAMTTDTVFAAAKAFVTDRFASTKEDPSGIEQGQDTESDEEEFPEETDEDADALVHLGTVTLAKLQQLLNDERNYKNQAFRDSMVDFVKPAFLIDGQHRVTGAAKFGTKGLPFIVCGLFDASWSEQVFQFTVVNLKPKTIPPSLITSIAALSLTKGEHDEVEARLEGAGVRMAEVSVMSLVAYDPQSPFADKIAMAVGDPKAQQDFLGYGAAKRIANVWYRASRTSLTNIAKQLIQSNNSKVARAQWRDSRVWFDFFCAFWDKIRDHYPETLWQKGEENRLFIGATLWALQETLLLEADGQMPSHWKLNEDSVDYETRITHLQGKLLEVVDTILPYIPTEVWTIPWAKTGQDTNKGRADLVKLLRMFVESGKKGSTWKNWRSHEWFKADKRE